MISVVVRIVRPLWSLVFNLWFGSKYALKYWFDPKSRLAYEDDRRAWDSIQSLDDLVEFFRTSYKYVYDGPVGILDHDNTMLEMFISGGDCDDVALFAMRKLKKLGYDARRMYFYGLHPEFGYFDCLYTGKDGKRYMFNYANCTPVIDDGVLATMNSIFRGGTVKTIGGKTVDIIFRGKLEVNK